MVEPELVANGDVLQADRGKLSVGNGEYGSIEGADAGGTQPDIFHEAFVIDDLHAVANMYHLVEDDGDSADHVLQGPLGRQGDGNTAHAKSRESGGEIHAEMMEAGQQTGEEQQQVQRSPAKAQERRGSVLPEAHHAPAEEAFDYAVQQNQYPDNGCNRDDRRRSRPELAFQQWKGELGNHARQLPRP